MQPNTKTIKHQFKKSIDKYNENAIIQKQIAEILINKLPDKKYIDILEIGAGSGLLTEQISKHCSFENYYANDLVEKSEIYIKKFIPNCKFTSGDFRKIKFNAKFDLIAANAVFQWYENLEKIFEQCRQLLKPNGILAFSTFSPENYKEIKTLTGLSLNYKTQDEIIQILNKNFKIIDTETYLKTIHFDNPLKILAHMKNTGVNSLSDKPMNIKDIKHFCEQYKNSYPNCELTYSPIIVIAELK